MSDPSLVNLAADRLPELLVRFQADRRSLEHLLGVPYSPHRRVRLRAFWAEWEAMLDDLPFEALTRSDQADWLLLRLLLGTERSRLDREERQFAQMEPLLPFALDLISLEEERRRHGGMDPVRTAERLQWAADQAREVWTRLRGDQDAKSCALSKPAVAHRAAQVLARLLETLSGWFTFYHAYDPLFTWWVERPYHALEETLQEYAGFLRREIAGAEDEEAIVGDPIGRPALLDELSHNLIPYTPEELVRIARREIDWCSGEFRRAAQDMGLGEDWRAALERVKEDHVAPGDQPALVRDLALEAILYVEENELLTVPPLAAETWRMEMMTPEEQKVNPFFLGGKTITVSFPTCDMEHPQKRMSLRGNNRHFARATVQHELIPGHHLQGFFQERYRPYRRLFYTPFWVEGWTLHWEMLLWDLGFPRTPEERIGMLFWRAHRCARVLFSLGFHLGQMTPNECIEMLVQEVGHERDNAIAEVRRSFGSDYDPLYQCAYLIGGLQVRSLHRELVGSGRMTHREFHHAFLQENCMPIALLRALLSGHPLERDFRGDWRFYPLEPEGNASSCHIQ
jgi:uncharacterized protein DUF885